MSVWKEIAQLHFNGARFDNHALEVDDYAQLQRFKQLLIETAKDQWRLRNPSKKRLPKGFLSNINLFVRETRPGSAVAPLEMECEEGAANEFEQSDYNLLEDAFCLVIESYLCAEESRNYPEGITRDRLDDLAAFAASVGENESVDLKTSSEFNGSLKSVKVSRESEGNVRRGRIQFTEGEILKQGRVVEADIQKGTFKLCVSKSQVLEIPMPKEYERDLLGAFRDHKTCEVRVRAIARSTRNGVIEKVVAIKELLILEDGEDPFVAGQPSALEIADKAFRNIPDEAWDDIPRYDPRDADRKAGLGTK